MSHSSTVALISCCLYFLLQCQSGPCFDTIQPQFVFWLVYTGMRPYNASKIKGGFVSASVRVFVCRSTGQLKISWSWMHFGEIFREDVL